MTITPFRLAVAQSAIDDLHQRIDLTRWPDQAPDAPWSYGTDVTYLRELVSWWRTGYDWRETEAGLNAFAQFRTTIAGIDVHFLHVEGRGPAPRPLLLSHGWPGSILEFMKLIPRLTDPARFGGNPADAFTVVAPSLPGYTLSFREGQARQSLPQIGEIFHTLMTERLGYARFGAQGGDWGSFVTAWLAATHPSSLTGIHLNMMPLRRDAAMFDSKDPDEKRYLGELERFLREETGYQWIQGTRPQTLAFGLSDSPAGLAAWLVEKFRAWTDCDGHPENALTREEMLGDISLYWFTNCIGASFWPYYARMHSAWPIPHARRIEVPTGYCEYPREILRPPRVAAERVFDVRRWTVAPKGGHFAALEQPDHLAAEIREHFRGLT